MKLKAALLGGGSWGTTVASLMASNTPTTMWARSQSTVDDINNNHQNSKYLPDSKLTESLRATTSIEEAVKDADLIVMGVPSQVFRSVLEDAKPYIRPWAGHPAGVLTGPNLAREILAGQAAASVIAMVDDNIAISLQKVFRTGLFRVYTNDDVIGCELGGALKNVIAIAAGMGDGAGAGDNTRAAVITRGLAELTRLGVAMGGKPATFSGLAGMGDLVATCISGLSRNRHVGFQLGQGRSLDEIIEEMSMVAEGVKTCGVVMELAKEYDVEMPITSEVYKVIQDGNTVMDAFKGLLRRRSGSEAEPG